MALTDNAWYVNAATGFVVTNIGSAQGASGATLTLAGVTIPAGAFVIVVASEVTSAAAGSFSDGTNTYSVATSGAMSTAAGFGTIFTATNASAVSNVTVTYTRNTTGRASSFSMFYVAGAATSSAIDTAFTAHTAVNSATPTVTSAAAPAANGELIIGACAYSNAAAKTLTNPTGFLTPFVNQTGQSTASVGGGNFNAGGNTAITYSPTLSGASDNITFVLAIKPLTAAVGYWAKTSWKASNTQHCGDLTRPNVTAINNERMFVCIASTSGTGTTGASEPATLSSGATRGLKVTDNTVTWQEATGVAALNGDLSANTPNWTTIKNTAITLGQVIKNNAGNLVLICTTAGTAGNGSEPSWSAFTNAGATTADNTVTWTTLGASFSNWAAPHARVNNALAATWAQFSNFVYIGNTHYEIQTTTWNVAPPGTLASGITKIVCVNSGGSVPPGPSDLTTGAKFATSGVTTVGVGTSSAYSYIYGITFVSSADGAGASQLNPTANSANGATIYDNCVLQLSSTSGFSGWFPGANGHWEMRNSSLSFTNTLQVAVYTQGNTFIWKNTSSPFTGANKTVNFLVEPQGAFTSTVFLEGLDCSAITISTAVVRQNVGVIPAQTVVKDCKLPSVTTYVTAGEGTQQANKLIGVSVDTAGSIVTSFNASPNGIETTETTLTLAGGAMSATTAFSKKIVVGSSTSVQYYSPFTLLPVVFWNSRVGSALTLTMHGLYQGTALPNNNEAWMTAEYFGTTNVTQGSFVTNGFATPLDTASALSADTTADWTGSAAAYQTAHAYGAFTGYIKAGNASPQQVWFMSSHSGTGTSGSDSTIFNGKADGAQVTDNTGANQIVWQAMMRFSGSVTFTPQVAGLVTVYWSFAKASATYWLDPTPFIPGLPILRTITVAPGYAMGAIVAEVGAPGGNFAFIQ